MNTKPNFYDMFSIPQNVKTSVTPNGNTMYSIDYIDRDYEDYDYDEYEVEEENKND